MPQLQIMTLRELRIKNELTQAQAGKMVGVTPTGWLRWELGQRQISLINLSQISLAFGCRIAIDGNEVNYIIKRS